MEEVFKSMDDVCEFDIVHFYHSTDGSHYYCLLELSALQALREIHLDTPLKVIELYSQSQRIEQKLDKILAAKTVIEFLEIVIPLVEGGCFPCDDLRILIDNQIHLFSHDDGEVHLSSIQFKDLQDIVKKILVRQGFSPEKILSEMIANPDKYLQLERPDKIVAKYDTFDEVIEKL